MQSQFKLFLVAIVATSAFGSGLDRLEKIATDAQSLGAIRSNAKLQGEYETQLKSYLGDLTSCPKFQTGLEVINKQEAKTPGLAANLLRPTVNLNIELKNGYRLRSVPRPLHAFWIWNAKNNCTQLQCNETDKFLGTPWAPAVEGSKVFVFEKDGKFTGTSILVAPAKKGGRPRNLAFVSDPRSNFDLMNMYEYVALLDEKLQIPIQLVDAKVDYSAFTMPDPVLRKRDSFCQTETKGGDKVAASTGGNLNPNGSGISSGNGSVGSSGDNGIKLTNESKIAINLSNGNTTNETQGVQAGEAPKETQGGAGKKTVWNASVPNAELAKDPNIVNYVGNKNANSAKTFSFTEVPQKSGVRNPAAVANSNSGVTNFPNNSAIAHTGGSLNANTNRAGAAANGGNQVNQNGPVGNSPGANDKAVPEKDSVTPNSIAAKEPTELERLIAEAKSDVKKSIPVEKNRMQKIMSVLAKSNDPALRTKATKEISGIFVQNPDVQGSYEAIAELQKQDPETAKKMAQNVEQFYCEFCEGCAACPLKASKQ